MLARVSRRLAWKIKRCGQVDIGKNVKQTILIAGSGRSGTTWLGDVVAAATRSRQIFEPFVHNQNRELTVPRRERNRDIQDFQDRSLYIPFDKQTSPEHDSDLLRILQGRIRNPWCDRPIQYGIYNSRVIKAIRGNMVVGYIARRWPQVKCILLLRDMNSVVNSQLRYIADGTWQSWDPAFVLSQPVLLNRHLQPFEDLLHSVRGDAEKLALKWCIENYVALRETGASGNVLPLHYEDLCKGPANWEPVAAFLSDGSWRPDRLEQVVNQRSRTAHRSLQEIREQVDGWQHLNAEDIARLDTIRQRFQLDRFAR